jgi:hypothetical protein
MGPGRSYQVVGVRDASASACRLSTHRQRHFLGGTGNLQRLVSNQLNYIVSFPFISKAWTFPIAFHTDKGSQQPMFMGEYKVNALDIN